MTTWTVCLTGWTRLRFLLVCPGADFRSVDPQLLRGSQYLCPPTGDIVGLIRVGHHNVEEVGSRVTTVASSHSSRLASLCPE
jgi:hypothetical protein